MRRITAVLAAACAALALAGAASSTTFGVADDAGKYAEDGGAGFFTMLTQLGMTENRMAVFWDPTQPATIYDQAFFDRAIPQAQKRGIEVIFAIYPLKARAIVDTPNGVQLFAQYAAKVVERYPYVRKVICLNEGNQPRFHQPQFDDAGNGISGYVQEQAMAACYDAVKTADPNITVIAFGLSPRGNDDFDAPSNVSHSPIRFLKEVGEAYKPSARSGGEDVAVQRRRERARHRRGDAGAVLRTADRVDGVRSRRRAPELLPRRRRDRAAGVAERRRDARRHATRVVRHGEGRDPRQPDVPRQAIAVASRR